MEVQLKQENKGAVLPKDQAKSEREQGILRACDALSTAVKEISDALNPLFDREDMRAMILEQFSNQFRALLDKRLKWDSLNR